MFSGIPAVLNVEKEMQCKFTPLTFKLSRGMYLLVHLRYLCFYLFDFVHDNHDSYVKPCGIEINTYYAKSFSTVSCLYVG